MVFKLSGALGPELLLIIDNKLGDCEKQAKLLWIVVCKGFHLLHRQIDRLDYLA